jgi:hypothetical protein
MNKTPKNPYMGFRTYLESDSALFVGRTEDTEKIYERIEKNDITILYANSGIGKSSVINAGLCPKFKSNRYFPLYIRCGKRYNTGLFDKEIIDVLNSPQNLSLFFGNSERPLILKDRSTHRYPETTAMNSQGFKVVSLIDENSDALIQQMDSTFSQKSLWWFLRTRRICVEVLPGIELTYTPVLIFDQFEEFFDHSKTFAQSGDFISWLNKVFSPAFPKEIQQAFDKHSENSPLFGFSFSCRALLSMRREYIGQLDYWAYQDESTRNTSLLYNRYFLRPLQKAQAEQVISLSKKLKPVKNPILKYIGAKEWDGYPTILLSVICYELLERNSDFKSLSESTNVEGILKSAYERIIGETSLSLKQIEDVERRLVDRESSKRIRRRNTDLLKIISNKQIDELLNSHIITSVGENFYELIHDRIAEIVAEKINHTKKRKENALLRKSELSVLTESGRRLIDNAVDFGGFRTINQRPSHYPFDSWVTMAPQLQIRQIQISRTQRIIDKFYLKGIYDEEKMDETFTHLYFSNTDGKRCCTNDGIFQYKVKYCGEKIEEVKFFGKTDDDYIYVSGGYHGVKIEIEELQNDGSYIEKRTYLNHKGEAVENVDDYAILRIYFDMYGLIKKVRYFDREDKPCFHANGNHGFDSTFDEDGHEISRVFVGKDGITPIKIISGVYGRKFEYNNKGLLFREINVDDKGENMLDADNYCIIEYSYDTEGKKIKESYYDLKEKKLCLGHKGYAEAVIEYGNRDSTECYYDDDGHKVPDKDGYYVLYNTYDEQNRIISSRYKDNHGNLTLDKEGCSGCSITYDERGRLSSYISFGENSRQKTALWVEYNQYSTHIIKVGYLTPDGQRTKSEDYDCYALGVMECGLQYPVIVFLDSVGRQQKCTDGYWAVMKEHNLEGDIIRETYYDQFLQPTKDINGYFGCEIEYDYCNNTQKIRFIQEESAETNEVSSILQCKNKHGEITKILFLDRKGGKTKGADGTCGRIIRYNDDLTIKEQINVDEQELPVEDNDGICRCIEERVLVLGDWKIAKTYSVDLKGNVVPDAFGNYFVLCEYGNDGREVRMINADKYGKPKKTENGYAIAVNKFDKRGNLIEELYLDENDNFCINEEIGAAGKEMIYDEQDRIVSLIYFDNNRVPIQNKDNGAFICKAEYLPNTIRISYFDKEGKPMTCTSGYEVLERFLDEKGETIAEYYYEYNHTPMPDIDGDFGCLRKYERINGETRTRICYLGENHKPHITKNGYACKETCVDEKDRLIYEKYLDETMHPICMWENETYMVKNEYDDEHNEVIKRYYKPNDTIGKGEEGVSIRHIYKDAKGRPVKELLFDSRNVPFIVDNSICGYMVNYDDDNNSELLIAIDENGDPCNNSKGLCKRHCFKDEMGRTIKEMYYDAKDNPYFDEDGDAGKLYIYDTNNSNEKTTVSLDSEEKIHINNKGWAFETIVNNEEGKPIYRFQYDADHNPIPDENGDFGTMIVYGEIEGTYVKTLLDTFGNPHMSTLGYASCQIVKDEKGRICKEMYYDVDGTPSYDSLGDAGTGYIYDDNDPQRVIYVSLDEKGNPRTNVEGWTYKMKITDGDNRVVFFMQYDIDNHPMANDMGDCGVKYDYLEDGKSYYESYLDEAGENHMNNNGVARKLMIKDDFGRTLRQMNYDLNGNAVFDELGDAGIEYVYEQNSYSPAKMISLNEDGQPRKNIEGYAIRQLKHDEEGRITEEFFFDVDGSPATDNHGCYGIRYEYYENKSIVVCLNEKGIPFVTKDGFAAISKVRDESGRVIQEVWYDETMKPIADEIGDYGILIEYCDDGGRITTSLGLDMKPRINLKGYAKRYTLYDENNRLIEEHWLDTEGNPISDSFGDYGTGYIYGEDTNDMTYISLDIDGNPRLNNKGWAFNRKVMDEKGRVVLDLTYDVQRNPVENELGDCGTIREYYDDENKHVEISLGEKGEPHINKYGFAKKAVYRDNKGRIIKERMFDTNDIPVPDLWGDCGTNYDFDDEHNAVTIVSLDENEKPRINIKGWAFETKVYDEKNRVISRLQYDTEHCLIPNADGDCGEIIEYDDTNNSRTIMRIDVDGNVRIDSWGMAILCRFEDADGRPMQFVFYDENREPVCDENGNFGIGFIYDDDPQVRTMVCLGKNGEPHDCVYGFAYRKEFLNDNNEIIKSFRYNVNQEPIKAHECRTIYCNDDNHTIIRTFYDFDGNECNNEKGYFKEISFTDKQGGCHEIYFDSEGNLVTPLATNKEE